MTAALQAIAAGLLSWALTWAYLRHMRTRGRLEPPSARGMHKAPVVTGAGAALLAAAAVAWAIPDPSAFAGKPALLAGAAGLLAVLSWLDDFRGGLAPAVRLGAHMAAVALVLLSLEPDQRIFPAVPLLAERVLAGLAWLWFINLFNFMDGIDGLAGNEAVALGVGFVLVAGLAPSGSAPMVSLALVLAAAAGGYLVWNWHPAKVMMGDTGSIPLGFLLGWLMIELALQGHAAAATILPLYFVADATLTLAKRIRRGEKPWEAHREHFYQRAVLAGRSPAAVVIRVSIANLVLVLLAIISLRHPVVALAGAAAVVGLLLTHLHRVASENAVQRR